MLVNNGCYQVILIINEQWNTGFHSYILFPSYLFLSLPFANMLQSDVVRPPITTDTIYNIKCGDGYRVLKGE